MENKEYTNQELADFYYAIAMRVSRFLMHRDDKRAFCEGQKRLIEESPIPIHGNYLSGAGEDGVGNLHGLRKGPNEIPSSTIGVLEEICQYGPVEAEEHLKMRYVNYRSKNRSPVDKQGRSGSRKIPGDVFPSSDNIFKLIEGN
jgi:hypothetical protein